MAKLVLSDVSNILTATSTINNNNTLIEQAVENTLSRDGTSPNEMNTDLDMNNHRIYNLPKPSSNTEPLRLIDILDHDIKVELITTSGFTRSEIPSKTILVDNFFVTGETVDGDIGSGALYTRGTVDGLRAIQDFDGNWWNLTFSGEANVGHFGAKGDGVTDDTFAIQLAIDTVCPFEWKGTTRATELASGSGSVYVPKGSYKITQVLRLAPNLTIRGDGCGNDWTSRSGATGGAYRNGSALMFEIGFGPTYAIDTAPYNDEGVREFGALTRGLDSFNGIRTEVQGIQLRDIAFVGAWDSKGLNMSGAVKASLTNVVIFGFHIGIRWSASWFTSMKDTRIFVGWKGLIAWYDVTDLAMYNVTIQRHFESPAYTDAEESLPPTDSWWTSTVNNWHAGIVNYYSNLSAYGLTVENFNSYSQGYNAVNNFNGIYIEGISQVAIVSKGPDQNHEKHVFDTIVSSPIGDLIMCNNSRLEVECLNHNYTQGGFNNLFRDIVASSTIYTPILKGLFVKGGTDFPVASTKRADVVYSQGTWTPLLRAGGISLGTHVSDGEWFRVGNIVHVTGALSIATLNGSTGSLDIAGLPFRSYNRLGFEWSSLLAFAFNLAGGGANLRLEANKYEIWLTGKTHSDVSNGVDLRFSMAYVTDEAGLF